MKHSEFKKFIKTELKEAIFKKYLGHRICSEADLQCYVWQHIRRYIHRNDSRGSYKVLNRCYFKKHHAYPDIAIFKGKPPSRKLWAAIELKEVRELKSSTVKAETDLLLGYKDSGCERAYLIFVARKGKRVTGRKGRYAYYFSETPIILQEEIRKRQLKVDLDSWEKIFKAVKVFKD